MRVHPWELKERLARLEDYLMECRLISEGWMYRHGKSGGGVMELYGCWVAPQGVTQMPDWLIERGVCA